MSQVQTVQAKYIFLDVVDFTRNRSIEAQSEIVGVLNHLVLDVIKDHQVPDDQIILIPTGDGICIALLNIESPYDIHIQISLGVIKRTHEYNESIQDEMRKFRVRIGVNANTDNLVTDINSRKNIAGAGINMAQRVMSLADGNQILVGQTVFDMLKQREQYMSAFRELHGHVKKGLEIAVYQLVSDDYIGLNTNSEQASLRLLPLGTSFQDYRRAFQAATDCIEDYFQQCKSNGEESPQVEAKIIAVAMTYSWHNFIEHIPAILSKYPSGRINVQIVFVDYRFLGNLPISKDSNVNWVNESKQRMEQAQAFVNTNTKKYKNRLSFTIKTYSNLPHWHGLLLNFKDDEKLFLGRTSWLFDDGAPTQTPPTLTVGGNKYRYYDRVSSGLEGIDQIQLFAAWHLYYFHHYSVLVCSSSSE